MNEQNLRPPFTPSEAREYGKRGAEASARSRRRKRDMAGLAGVMLQQELTGTAAENINRVYPDLDGDATMAARLMAGQIGAAVKGNVRAARFVQELADREAARETHARPWRMDPLDLTVDCVRPYRDLHAFYDGTLDLDDMVFRGGRGGGKSSFAARLAYETMEQDAAANVVYGRRFATDLRPTVFTSFVRLLGELGVEDEWEVTRSPMRCTRLASGTAVYFFGMDNAEQLKSFVPEVGYVKLLIFEEADEMQGDEQMDSAADTFLRANGHEGARQLRLKVFNPPASRNNFLNEWCSAHVGDERVRVYDFSYEHVPPEWLGQVFLDRAARAKRERPEWYRNNYLGEVTGTGGELFANVEFREIPDEEVERLEAAGHGRSGLDYGYEHPMVWQRVAWDEEHDTVVALGEVVAQRAKLGDFLRECERWRRDEVICDSAEPDRIAEMREWGWDAVGAVKQWGRGRGRAYSWDWLRMRSRIVVDPDRTPHLAHELRTLEFERVRGGGYSSKYPDLGEDSVMATIYALNREIRAASTYDG